MKTVVLAMCGALLAPYQCGARTTNRPVEDTAPAALWTLAERFETDGDTKARDTTLRQLAERYPQSRFGKRARIELGMATQAETESEDDSDAAPAQESGEGADADDAT
jgi:outer membrane protein assembly factor BamD (BamD/ComL family)